MKLEVVVLPVADVDRGRHEEEIGQADPDWPDWYARYMLAEQAGRPSPAGPGAST